MLEARQERILRQHVQTDRLLGVEAVPVGDGPVGDAEADSPMIDTPKEDEMAKSRPDAKAKKKSLDVLNKKEVSDCTKCELHEGRTQTVFGEGAPDADLMFIGEGPGRDEDEQGRPFVGRAGKKLNEMITAMGLKREDIYIANVVKCRPPQNRTPTPAEAATCFDYLFRQISIIQPKVIVTLGSPATKLLLDTNVGITKLRGNWAKYDGLLPDGPSIDVMPTYHPAYLLRAYTMENRKKVWSDLKKALNRLSES